MFVFAVAALQCSVNGSAVRTIGRSLALSGCEPRWRTVIDDTLHTEHAWCRCVGGLQVPHYSVGGSGKIVDSFSKVLSTMVESKVSGMARVSWFSRCREENAKKHPREVMNLDNSSSFTH